MNKKLDEAPPSAPLLLDPELIHIPDNRVRDADPDEVDKIAVSMGDPLIGQFQAIEVMAWNGALPWRLVFGLHRLLAARKNGQLVKAQVFEGSEDEARMHEIDENLHRRELGPFDQAAFIAERRAVYERLHGVISAGRPRKSGNSANMAQLSFFDDTTGKFGLPRRTITRALWRWQHIEDDVWLALRGLRIPKKGNELDALARLGGDEQRKVIEFLTRRIEPARTIGAAVRIVRGTGRPSEEPETRQFNALQAAWRKAGTRARREFLDALVQDGAIRGSNVVKRGAKS